MHEENQRGKESNEESRCMVVGPGRCREVPEKINWKNNLEGESDKMNLSWALENDAFGLEALLVQCIEKEKDNKQEEPKYPPGFGPKLLELNTMEEGGPTGYMGTSVASPETRCSREEDDDKTRTWSQGGKAMEDESMEFVLRGGTEDEDMRSLDGEGKESQEKEEWRMEIDEEDRRKENDEIDEEVKGRKQRERNKNERERKRGKEGVNENNDDKKKNKKIGGDLVTGCHVPNLDVTARGNLTPQKLMHVLINMI